ncbi:MAG TPA: YdcF family protein, partial [Pyrinomonadaceae bacterium]|nr:YdcF family protein [Pyrinomonadaceae bacterium]
MRLRRLAKTSLDNVPRAARNFLARRGRVAKALLATCAAALLLLAFVAAGIYTYGGHTSDGRADAAVVLGAAVWTRRPSPVFRERINHAVELYKRGRVRKLILTGGRGA